MFCVWEQLLRDKTRTQLKVKRIMRRKKCVFEGHQQYPCIFSTGQLKNVPEQFFPTSVQGEWQELIFQAPIIHGLNVFLCGT